MSPSTIVILPEAMRRLEVLPAAAREVVEDDDLLEALGDQSVGDVRSDQAGAAGDQRSCVGHEFGLVDRVKRGD